VAQPGLETDKGWLADETTWGNELQWNATFVRKLTADTVQHFTGNQTRKVGPAVSPAVVDEHALCHNNKDRSSDNEGLDDAELAQEEGGYEDGDHLCESLEVVDARGALCSSGG
jgi:hypothetical protein